MTVRKGIYRILACPCGFSALQQEEDPKLYRCDHCGAVRTLDSPEPVRDRCLLDALKEPDPVNALFDIATEIAAKRKENS